MSKNMKMLLGVFITCFVLILMVSFVLAYSGRDVTMLQEREIRMMVNGQQIIIPMDEDRTVYDLPCLMTNNENIFVLENDPSATVMIGDKKLSTGKKKKIAVPKLADNYRLMMTVSTGRDERVIYLRTYSSLLPKGNLKSAVVNGDETRIVSKDAPVMYILDGNGNIIWYLARTISETKGALYSNFQKHVNGEKVLYTYHVSDPEIDQENLQGYFPGYEMLLDEKLQPVELATGNMMMQDSFSIADDTVAGRAIGSESFILLDKKNYICEATEMVTVDNVPAALNPNPSGVRVAKVAVQEVKDGKIVWEWNSTDMPALYTASYAGNDFEASEVQDYLHIDRMVLSSDGKSVLVTFKNTDATVNIDRETGKAVKE